MSAFVDNDVASVWRDPEGKQDGTNLVGFLYRGDSVVVLEQRAGNTRVSLGIDREGWLRRGARLRATGLLEFAFVDVGQGDACLMTTPTRARVLIDGGESKLAARYLAARYWDETSAGHDVMFDAIVATHGDADHLEGLSTLVLDSADDVRERKRIRVAAKRVFHNGLVKRAANASGCALLGPTVQVGDRSCIPVTDDPRTVADPTPSFRRWQHALNELHARYPCDVKMLTAGEAGAFSFLPDVRVEVLGPRAVVLADGRKALTALGGSGRGSSAASRTMNGHSIALRVTLGNVNVLLTGDLNTDAERDLVRRHDSGELSLRAEVLKVPHHGSDDIAREFIHAVQPIASVISAGDEDARRDYMHPRANLLGLLGRSSRGVDPVIFVTNLAAFDRWAGKAFRAVRRGDDDVPDIAAGTFYARERTAYGIIHVRTDGSRLLVVRRGARRDRHEPYSFEILTDGSARGLDVDRV